MTCIAAIREGGVVYMMGDSAAVGGTDLDVRADSKVFINGPFLFGVANSFRFGQLLRFNLTVENQGTESDYEYIVTKLVPAIKSCIDGEVTSNEDKDKDDEESKWYLLVGYGGKIYNIDDTLAVAINKLPFDSIGCGSPYAKGVLYATSELVLTPKERLKMSLQAAEQFSAGVRGPYIYKEK